MKIDISADNAPVDADLEHFVRSRVNFALGNRRDRVVRVAIYLFALEAGENADKYCLVRVSLTRQSDLEIEISDSNIYVAIHRAVDRAGWEVSRCLTREWRRNETGRDIGKMSLGSGEPERAA
jgi:putative sigma-54 modulation protein